MTERRANPLRFTRHALESMAKRGASQKEVSQAIAEATWSAARAGRFECAMDFPYNGMWNGNRYSTKQVVPIFRDEPESIVVITVYVFYF